jgi:transposase
MKSTREKEEYKRSCAIKQKVERISYLTIPKNLDVKSSNVYDWIKKYREYNLEGTRNKRKNGGRKPVISTHKNIEMIKDLMLNESPRILAI